MILALVLNLACAVHAETAPIEPNAQVILDRAQSGTDNMLELERSLRVLTPDELAEAQAAARELTSTCPYNGATLQVMGTLIAHVPQDSATRPGVDAMANVLELLDLDPGEGSIAATTARLNDVDALVAELTEDQSARIEASGDALRAVTHDGAWPPKVSFLEWREQLTVEGHHALVEVIDLQVAGRC